MKWVARSRSGWLAAAWLGMLLPGAPASALPTWASGAFHQGAPIALSGDPAPGGTYTSFSVKCVSGAGHVVLGASVLGGIVSSGLFRVSGGVHTVVALNGEPAPGTGAGTYNGIYDCAVNDLGDVVFLADVTGGSATSGVFLDSAGTGTDTAVALRGQPAPGTAGTYSQFLGSNPPAINAAGSVAFAAIYGPPSFSQGVFLSSGGTQSAIALEGESSPAGGTYFSISGVALDTDGRVFFGAFASGGPSGIFVSDAGVETPVALEGDAAPGTGGGTLAAFDGFSVNDLGELAFSAFVVGGSAASGIFLSSGGNVASLALAGGAAPGTGGGTFSSFRDPSLNESSEVAFSAGISGGTAGGGVAGIFRAASGSVTDVATFLAPVPTLSGSYFFITPNLYTGEYESAALDDSGAVAFSALIYSPIDDQPGDDDGDGVVDHDDNCLAIANTDQCDTDRDGYGNLCDGDFEQSGSVSAGDFTNWFLPAFKSGIDVGNGTDMDCDGRVNANDFTKWFLPQFLTGMRGPSGLDCAGRVPCFAFPDL